jgi:hypothetical protein
MELEEPLLFLREGTDIGRTVAIDAELDPALRLRARRHDQLPLAERDEPAIEQEVGLRRQQQSVVRAQTLPRLLRAATA